MSTISKSGTSKQQQISHHLPVEPSPQPAGVQKLSPPIERACSLIATGDYAGAANLLGTLPRDPQTRNALGVCLMRMGDADQAVDVYRSFVLVPGTVIERPEVSNSAKRNFATALLMKGLPSGTQNVLSEIHDPDHPVAVRLKSAIRQWEKTLPWLRWLDWKTSRIEPPQCKVVLDFEPGEFDFEVQTRSLREPVVARKSSPKLAA